MKPGPATFGHSGWVTALVLFLWALGLRLLFALLTSGTFDVDEFVIVTLGRAVAQGAVLYRDVTYFHPPGMLVLFAGLQRLVLWWPVGRALTLVADSMTAVFVWRIGKELFGDTEALVAGLLYAASPIALVSAVRIGPDPIITALGVLGLLLLLSTRSRAGALGAGLCLALAVWTKYSGALFFPVYLLAAPHRARSVLASWAISLLVLFAPSLSQAHALYSETVLWQLSHRSAADLLHRLGSVSAYWLLLNPLAVVALWRWRRPLWLSLGFCLGAVFLLTAQAYYHYFVVVVPFAALLAAPIATRLVQRAPRLLLAGALSLACLWGLDIAYGPPALRLFVSASPFSAVRQTATVLDRTTAPGAAVLTDEFEYALFAHRALATDYFWNMSSIERAQSLERRLPGVAAVVATKGEDSYPPGFAEFLEDRNYPRIQTAGTVIWLIKTTG